MKPKTVNLHCYRGQTYRQNIYFKSRGEPIDLTGVTCKAQIRPKENSPKLVTEFGCTVYGNKGMIELYLSSETTADIKPGTYAWDLQVTNGEGDVEYYLAGNISFTGRVTE